MSPIDQKIARVFQDAPKLVTATFALMEKLTRVLLLENDLVSQRKIKEHTVLLKEKQRLAMDYRANMKALAEQPDILKKLSDEAKALLKNMARNLAEAADKNALMLRAAVNATQQLLQNIMAMVRSEAMPVNAYKNPAKAHMALGVYSPTCPPVAVRRSV